MPDDNMPSQEIPWYRDIAVFRDFMTSCRQLLQKSNRANHLRCSHRFSLTCSWYWYYILSASGRGCRVTGIYSEVLVYAADLVFMQDLRSMRRNLWEWNKANCAINKAYWKSVPPDGIPRYLASPRYIIPSLLIPRYFSDTGIPHIPKMISI